MKRITLIGISIVAVFVLLMTPSISAVQYNTAVESNKAQILEQIRSMNVDELREKIKNLDLQEVKEKLKNIDSNERMQLLQTFIKSSSNKSEISGNFFLPLLGGILFSIPFLLYITIIIIFIIRAAPIIKNLQDLLGLTLEVILTGPFRMLLMLIFMPN
ncbi:MAG: hypothetical protein NT038_01115 [Euryarchaeota archaeon]|nr:hypothetical protein [Euryarchaeota archaeon]